MKPGISMIDTLRDFVHKMNALGIEYMVTGSFAMSAYGEIRMTRDIDVVVQLAENHLTQFYNYFKDEYYVSKESIRQALMRQSMFNVISYEHGGKIDCIIPKNTDFARESFARRYREMVSGIEFWTTTREDLMIAKLIWAKDTHSEMQIRDIANLTRSEYDSAYVDRWIKQLRLSEVWAALERWKIQQGQREK